MDWTKIKSAVAAVAPTLGGLIIPGPVGVGAGALIANALGTPDDPEEVINTIMRNPAAATEKLRGLQIQKSAEISALQIAAERDMALAINQTMRAEVTSAHPYARNWRPTIGYIVAYMLASLWTGLIYILFFKPTEDFVAAAAAAAELNTIFVAALAVLGINIANRSGDKRAAMGAPTAIESLKKLVREN
ncbi:MAG: hypothetical protein J4F41_00160 [Alphaproteobacteria bacterium]|nr:hypothetical protein [Alphaproteobacteria bacterium]